jgi:hypothetical protein
VFFPRYNALFERASSFTKADGGSDQNGGEHWSEINYDKPTVCVVD